MVSAEETGTVSKPKRREDDIECSKAGKQASAPTGHVVVQVLPRHLEQLQEALRQLQSRCRLAGGGSGIHWLQLLANQRACR